MLTIRVKGNNHLGRLQLRYNREIVRHNPLIRVGIQDKPAEEVAAHRAIGGDPAAQSRGHQNGVGRAPRHRPDV